MKTLILGNRLFSFDMQWGFQQAGCEAEIIEANSAEDMKRVLNESEADLLVTLGAPLELNKEAMAYLGNNRPAGLKYVHWDTDGITSQYFVSSSGEGIEMDVIYLSKPDIVLTMCPEMRNFMTAKGFKCEMMYYAYSPVTHYPMHGCRKEKNDIYLTGHSYSTFYSVCPNHYRYTSLKILLKPLLENGYSVQLYGDTEYIPLIKKILDIDMPRENYHGYIPYEFTGIVYNRSFINLVTQNHMRTITKRTFEILGSGGFVLSSDNDEIRKLFTPGRDLVVSSSPEQTLELVEYYQKNEEEWLDIRKNAALSVQNHTYKQRAEYIMELFDSPSPAAQHS